MKTLLLIVFSIFFMQSFAFADEAANEKKVPVGGDSSAGEVSSGGGSAIVCRDSAGVISQSPQVLDLYESPFTLPVPSGDLISDFIEATRRSYILMGESDKSVSDQTIEEELMNFMKLARFTDPNEYLVLLDDVGSDIGVLPAGCAREQVAIFFDKTPERSEYVIFDTEIWAAMDSLNQAALISHEKVYKYDRTLGEKDSKATRQSVAYMYATDFIPSALSDLPKEHLVCTTDMTGIDSRPLFSKSNVFYVYDNGDDKVIQFSRLMGRTILTKATVNWPGQFDLQNGDPEGLLDHDLLTVWEKGADKKIMVPLQGSQFDDLKLELQYRYNDIFYISLYRKGKLLEVAETTSCLRKN